MHMHGYNPRMNDFRFSIPIQIRYGDLDPQWHVNNARFLTFFEHARLEYLMQLGLFDGHDFSNLGLIVADAHVAFLAPINPQEKVRVYMRVTRLGNKSMNMEFLIENEETGEAKSRAEYVMVTYDYHSLKSVPIWHEWRAKIAAFEGIHPGPTA
jgi:acyl-CoA thioester hydrolase